MSPSPVAEVVTRPAHVHATPVMQATGSSALLSVSALAAAAVEGVCAALVVLKGLGLFTGLLGLTAAGASSWLHEDAVRIPLLVFAAGAALANLYVIWNAWRLRRSPAASWRVQPRTPAERRRIRLVVAASLVTLLLVAGEVYGHHILHAG